jgi:hypothetical protein
MFIDCITVGAVVNTVAFLVIMGLLKGHGVEKLVKTVRRVSHLHFLSTSAAVRSCVSFLQDCR